MDITRWLRQPTTIHGLAVAAAGAGAALAQVATGNPKVDAGIAIASYILVHLGIDDHSAGEQAAGALVTDIAHIQQTAPAKLLADASGAASLLQAAPAAQVAP